MLILNFQFRSLHENQQNAEAYNYIQNVFEVKLTHVIPYSRQMCGVLRIGKKKCMSVIMFAKKARQKGLD